MLEAVDLYKEGISDLVLLTKPVKPIGYKKLETLGAGYPQYHETKLQIALKLGVDKEDIVILNERVSNTYSEAAVAKEFMHENNLQSLSVVTSKLHSKRASMIFNDVLKDGFEIYMRPSRYDPYDPYDPQIVRMYTKGIFYEYQKIIFYKLIKLFSKDYPKLR